MKDLNDRGLENQVKGTVKEMKGRVRGDIGDATDNTSEHIKGRAEELKGKAQKNFGKAEKDFDSDNVGPFGGQKKSAGALHRRSFSFLAVERQLGAQSTTV